MFAPKVAKPQTKTAANSMNKLAPQHSVFATRPVGCGTVEQAHFLQRTIGNQATLRLLAQRDRSPTGNERSGQHEQEVANTFPKASRVSCNFANIPIFSPHQVERFHSKSSLPAFPLQSAIQNEQEADRIARDMRGAASDDTTLMDQHGSISAAPDGGAPASGAADAGSAPVSIGPVAVRNGPFHAPIDTLGTAGMEIAITLTSSTGVDADMSAVQDSEQVNLSYNHTGSFSGIAPLPSTQSGFMAGFPIPNDRHGTPKSLIIDRADNHGGDGQLDKDQLDLFTAPASGVPTPTAIPASGYRIRRTIKSGPGTKLVLRTEKSAKACTVNGFTTTAGPSPTQADEVVIRG